MTYSQLEQAVLGLLNQFTIAGDGVKKTYNLQQDILIRIPALADDAQIHLATYGKKIPATVKLEDLDKEPVGDGYLYSMPEDFYQFRESAILDVRDTIPRKVPFRGYINDSQFLFREPTEDRFLVQYYRYPRLLGENPVGTDRLDNTEDVQRLVPYYVAAHIAMYDDAYSYSALNNEFETRLARLEKPLVAEYCHVEDVYGP